MKARWGWRTVQAVAVLVMLMAGVVLLATAGCARFRAAEVPSDQKGAPMVITQQQVELLGKGVDKDVQVLASALENNTDGGSVIYVDHNGYIYDAAGAVVYDKNDPPQPLRVRTKIIAKLNSLQNFANVTGMKKVKYEVGGRSYLASLPDGLKHIDTCPVPLLLEIEGADSVGVKSPLAEQRVAAGQEREAIYAGLSKYAESKGAAFAVKVKAVADGVVQVTTATGVIVGQVLSAKAVTIAGVAEKAVEAVIKRTTGSTETVVAAGAEAQALCDGCSETGQ